MCRSLIITRYLCALIAAEIAVIDQWTKALVIDRASQFHYPLEITSFFNIVLTANRGISFGMFRSAHDWMPYVLTVLTGVVAVVLFTWMLRSKSKLITFALSLIIGGAVGNIIDRVRYSAVTDFLDFHYLGYHWPAFNVADSCIFVGVVLLGIDSIVRTHPPEKPVEKHNDTHS